MVGARRMWGAGGVDNKALGMDEMRETLRLKVDPAMPAGPEFEAAMARAGAILRRGGLVAFPTETVYGLGANALDAAAVARIFEAKQRPGWDPVIVHVSGPEMVEQVVAGLNANARRLAEAFWPGPMTLLLPKLDAVPAAVTAGRPLVGVRMPAHPVALALIRAAGVPVAAPSANRFGHTSPTRAEHVLADLDGRIDAIVDGGETAHGLESTVMEPREDGCVIYRPGVITAEQVRGVCAGAVEYFVPEETAREPEALPSPGVGIRHYAPRARMVLVEGSGGAQVEAFRRTVLEAAAAGERVGAMVPDRFRAAVEGYGVQVFQWGRWDAPEELGQRMYAAMRELDAAGVTVIVCPLPAPEGVGVAICDRLRKSARAE